ncbi:4'-phosphopantetheinyl transferase superfamily protein [Streptomyces bathyalis]|uniref:4'-phosphopantetheinyl transferase superfamily protein n=1 Tax=Streptomyces bathyalis TaxID=2710756 RepID=A0A7T1T328_9ACTN|nr:4'-phosphopantetheinyl transferase superfamily protein [Streptomyces bathyalis]QPP05415.1 4'-phosphopantetheinyl transferase superfamily protein [Streptomyces bathyalis]
MNAGPAGPQFCDELLLHGPGGSVRVVVETAPVRPPRTVAEQHRAGRLATAAALRRAGSRVRTVGRRRDGAPKFPPGIAGSLTHTEDLAVAAVAPGARGVGVDLEPRLPERRLHRFLLNEEERALLWRDGDRAGLRRLFAAKEAAFKALSGYRGAHGGLFWRVRLVLFGDQLWARAGDQYALVRAAAAPDFAFAVAVRLDEPPPFANSPRTQRAWRPATERGPQPPHRL